MASNTEEMNYDGEPLLASNLKASIERFIEHYNHHRHNDSLKNLTPADVHLGVGMQSYTNAKVSNETHLNKGVCNTVIKPPNINQTMSQFLR